MVSNPTQALQAEVNRLRTENESLRNELYVMRGFVQALQALSEAEAKFKASADLWRLLDEIMQQTLDLLSAPDGSLMLLDRNSGELEFVVVLGAARDLLTGQRLQPGEGIAGWVAQHGKSCVVRDVRLDPRFSARMDEESAFRTKSIAAAPLIGNGKVLGVVEVLNRPGDEAFTEFDQMLLTLLGRFAGEMLADIRDVFGAGDLIAALNKGQRKQ